MLKTGVTQQLSSDLPLVCDKETVLSSQVFYFADFFKIDWVKLLNLIGKCNVNHKIGTQKLHLWKFTLTHFGHEFRTAKGQKITDKMGDTTPQGVESEPVQNVRANFDPQVRGSGRLR